MSIRDTFNEMFKLDQEIREKLNEIARKAFIKFAPSQTYVICGSLAEGGIVCRSIGKGDISLEFDFMFHHKESSKFTI